MSGLLTARGKIVLKQVYSTVIVEFPTQRPVTRSFGVFFDLHRNKRLSKQSQGWWFEMPSRSLWRHCNEPPGNLLSRWICMENVKILSFRTIFNTGISNAVDIHAQKRQEYPYLTWSVSWMLVILQHKEPGHQPPWSWCSFSGIFRSRHQGDYLKWTNLTLFNYPTLFLRYRHQNLSHDKMTEDTTVYMNLTVNIMWQRQSWSGIGPILLPYSAKCFLYLEYLERPWYHYSWDWILLLQP